MTDYERLIRHHTTQTTLTTLSAATAQLVEELAREFLKDPATREELRAVVRRAFGDTIAQLRQPASVHAPKLKAKRAARKRSAK